MNGVIQTVPRVRFFSTEGFALRVLLSSAVVLAAMVGQVTYRTGEMSAVVSLLNLWSNSSMFTGFDTRILIQPNDAAPFFAVMSFGCSSLPLVMTFMAVALTALRISVARRLAAAFAVLALLAAVNIIRVATVVAVGGKFGVHSMAQVHDWFGTALTLMSGIGAMIVLYLFGAMPGRRNSQSIRASYVA